MDIIIQKSTVSDNSTRSCSQLPCVVIIRGFVLYFPVYTLFESVFDPTGGSEPEMKKTILCLLAVLCLCVSAAAAETAPDPVTEQELTGFLATIREAVLKEDAPLNDPTDESARSEDGTRFQYMTAVVFAEGTALAADTPVNALFFEDSEGPVFRGTGIDTQWSDLLAAFPLENKTLAGTHDEAVLYLRETEKGGFVYGRILRDGQRIRAVEYGELLASGGEFRRISVTYTLQNGLVTSLRFDGLNPSAGLMGADHAAEMLGELKTLASADEYQAVRSSRNGLELTAFGPEDLVFSGISYTELSPDTLPGTPESELIDNGDNTWLLRCDGDGYEAVFRCGADGKNASILSYTILDPDAEGPRGVRLGDLFSEDFCRFRNGENEMTEDMTELLYGTQGEGAWGYASYEPSAGETSLRYVTPLADGTNVELLLKYEENTLSEIILHQVD